RVDEGPVEAVEPGGERPPVGTHDPDLGRTETRRRLLELSGARFVHLDRDDFPSQHGRLPARCGAEIECALAVSGVDREADELRGTALRPDAPVCNRRLVDPPDLPRPPDLRV